MKKMPETMTKNAKAATGVTGGVGGGVVLVWLWSILVPEHPMPLEVAAAIGGIIGPLINRFLPTER